MKHRSSRRVIASLPSSLSISYPALTYLTTQAHRREIKSKEMLIALANVKGQEVTDTHTPFAHTTSTFLEQCGTYGFKSTFGALFFINLNVSHKQHADTHYQLATSSRTLSVYREKWRVTMGQLPDRMSSV